MIDPAFKLSDGSPLPMCGTAVGKSASAKLLPFFTSIYEIVGLQLFLVIITPSLFDHRDRERHLIFVR